MKQTHELGKVIHSIRQNKGYSQAFVSNGIMRQSTYSKVERNESEPSASKYLSILEKLDMSDEEFSFIQNNYNYSQKKSILQSLFSQSYNNLNRLEEVRSEAINYLSKQEDYIIQDVISICDGLIKVAQTHDLKEAKPYAEKVWKRLEKFDNWYFTEIWLISNILFAFPTETALAISNRSLDQLKKYKGFDKAGIITFNLKFNIVLLLIETGSYQVALTQIEELIQTCKKVKFHYQLAICYGRKGLLMEKLQLQGGEEYIQKGLFMLEAMEEEDLKNELQKEINHYLGKDHQSNKEVFPV